MRYIYILVLLASLFLVPALLYGGSHPLIHASAASDITDIQAVSKGFGTMITWRVEKGESVIGYSVYRLAGKRFVRVNGAMVPGAYVSPTASGSRVFSYYDRKGSFGDTYKIEVTEFNSAPYFSRSTQSVYSTSFVEPVNAVTPSGGTENVSVKNFPSEFGISAPFADIENQRWVASQPGVKIMVSSEGLTRVSRAALQNAGFDVSAPESNWQLYLEGVEQAIKIGPNGSYIEFYGKGVDLVETAKNAYFLIVGQGNGKRIEPLHIRRIRSGVVIQNFDATSIRKRKFLYLSTLLNGPEDNFFGEIIASNPVNIPFDLKGLVPGRGKSQITLDIQGFTYTAHNVRVLVNGLEVGTATGSGRARFVSTFVVPTSILLENGNTVQLQSLDTSDLSLLASITFNYKRKYSIDGGKLTFPTEHYRETKITGLTDPQVRFFDLSVPNMPSEVSNALIAADPAGGYVATLPAARGRKIYAVEPSAVLGPSLVEPNIPSTLTSTSNGADFLIITNPSWRAEADLWANYRAAQGMQTMVVDINDVFDEFNFGRVGSAALASFLQYAHTTWSNGPSYVLLLGDSTYDPRNYEGQGEFYFLPVKMVDTLYEETGSDDSLTDFDNDGLAEIPIGRIPARVPVDVSNALQKVMTFESTIANAPARGSLCASDLPNGFDFQALCGRLHDQLPVTIPKSQVNRGEVNAKTTLLGEMNSGRYIVNYSGHGSTGVWASSTFFGSADVPNVTNQSDLSIFTMLTCLNGYFIRPIDDGLSEKLLRSTAGGGVAVWSSTGSTTPDIQELMATRFFEQLGAGPMDRLGNLINDSKSNIAGGRDVRLSWVLLGDPATIVKSTAPSLRSKAKAGF